MKELTILAYSGGLDTTLSLTSLIKNHKQNVVTVTIDIGNEKDWKQVREKALRQGATEALVFDVKEEFADAYILHSLRADALYEDKYPLATALGRPLIAKKLVEVAEEYGARSIAHGCSGKGNDQLRFEHTITFLDPRIKIVAPIRNDQVKRSVSQEFAQTLREDGTEEESIYSVDENIWGRSVECGVLEDAWAEPPEEIYTMTTPVEKTPDEPLTLTVTFENGVPVALDGETMSFLEIIHALNTLGGSYGIGRIDMLENRVVGIKSREIYEAPAAMILHTAHREIESLTLSKKQQDLKKIISHHYADMIYQGFWHTSYHRDLLMYIRSTQMAVSGEVRLKLFKGSIQVTGRKSPFSLYDMEIASYETFDHFDSSTATGFIQLHGLESSVQMQKQKDLLFKNIGDFRKIEGE